MDEEGNFVDSHHILLLLIHYLHKVKGLSGKVVATFSVTPKFPAPTLEVNGRGVVRWHWLYF